MDGIDVHLHPIKVQIEILTENGNREIKEEKKVDEEVCSPESFLLFKFSGREWEKIYVCGTKEKMENTIKYVALEGVDPALPGPEKVLIINREAENLVVIGLCREEKEERKSILYEIKAAVAPALEPKPKASKKPSRGFDPSP